MPAGRWVRPVRRGGLVVLGLLHLWWGIAALVAPARFFAGFPFGRSWTGAYPPYNEHLVVDLGATFTTLAVLLLCAAALDDRRVSLVVLAGLLTFSALHLAFHATHAGRLGGGEYAASLVALALGVAAPAALLVLVTRGGDARDVRHGGAGSG